MREQCNHDRRVKSEPNHGRSDERRQQQPVKPGRDSLAAGYTTLDQASTEPYEQKERRGLGRDANYSTRY